MRLLSLTILLAVFFSACTDSESLEGHDSLNESRLDSLLLSGIDATRDLDFEEAQRTLNQVIAEAEVTGSERHVITGYINLGNLYNYFNLYDQALENLFLALEKSDEFQIEVHKNAILNNIGIVYSKNGSNEKAGEYFSKALERSRLDNDSKRIAMNLINLSIALSERRMNDSALTCLEEALVLYDQNAQKTNYLATLENIGNIYFDQGELDSALVYYSASYHGVDEEVDPWLTWEFAFNLSKAHREFNNLDSAATYLKEAIGGFKLGNDSENLIEAYRLQSEILREKGEANASADFAKLALAIQDSLVDVKSTDWISKHQLNYEYGKKEKELELLEEDARRTQLIWIFGSAGLCIILILVWLLMRSRVTRLNQKNLLLEKEQRVTQLTLEKNIFDQKKMEEEHGVRERISKIEKEKLKQELDFKNRMLMSKVMSVSNQNEQMADVVNLLDQAENMPETELNKALSNAKKMVQNQINLENEWESVKVHFEEVHPDFFSRLSQYNDSLNSSDLRMCAYLVLDLSPKEISNILNITPASIRKRRQRLKEKLNLDSEIDLSDWLRKRILNTN